MANSITKIFNFTKPLPLSLYIHIPWCIRKCPYCDFNSHQMQGKIPENDYINALLADLEQDLPKIQERAISSIFIGGGTPSILSPEAIYQLLTGVQRRLPIRKNTEITLEANPGSIKDNTRFQAFREAGINRLSLGIQSFNETALQGLERIHGRIEAINAIDKAMKAGFNQINFDLMFGLPAQTIEAALKDLQIAVSFQPSHLSWYQLTIEPNTPFYHNTPPLPDNDILWEMQNAGQNYLAKQGYFQYEISAYAKSGQQCQHNLNYWKFGDYLGIGAGAHGKISETHLGTITRTSKQRHPQNYLQSSPAIIANHSKLTPPEVGLEFMMNALRLYEGFTNQTFIENTGLNLAYLEKPIEQAYLQRWLVKNEKNGIPHIRATDTGMRFLNEVLDLFVP
ncbi:MAG: radical SAM family heme chaperone HemW [Gammaproteobacteria bacterium]|nr:MAG: radical SAM family heme chaperone HemW [Gammaproteobacteria bacterium]RKZ43759.1 MAG: radical SAM family heme chaperone HemW [Gammaproteobacteria bacterium]RKZ75729.1 MAG: radical SAM family heme chaperone HemW [Gammaproteobacteria bacterium]